jgi:outer membrane lipoprotein SlyB
MEQVTTAQAGPSVYRTHPVLIAAGVAVLLFSTLGAAALLGWIPTATSRAGDPPSVQVPAAQAPAPQKAVPASGKPAPAGALCPTCGVVEAVNAVEVKGKTSGVGAVAGGVAGGLLGNAIGGGSGAGNAVLTVGGAAGGAFAGDAIEGHVKKQTVWRVTIRMGDGSARTVSQPRQPPFLVGDRVRIVNGSTLERA